MSGRCKDGIRETHGSDPDGGSEQGVGRGTGEKWLDYGSILKVKPRSRLNGSLQSVKDEARVLVQAA